MACNKSDEEGDEEGDEEIKHLVRDTAFRAARECATMTGENRQGRMEAIIEAFINTLLRQIGEM